MKRSDKEALAASMGEVFSNSQLGLLVDYRGLTVGEVTELRMELNKSEAKMQVLKNRLAKIAIKGTAFESMDAHLTEPRAFIFAEEPVAPAKTLVDFLKTHDKAQLVGGVLVTGDQGKWMDADQVKALANLPSREELLAKLLFLFNAPTTNLVRTLNEVPAKFVRGLAAVRDSKGA